MNWKKVEKELGIKLPDAIKKFRIFKLKEETKSKISFPITIKKIKKETFDAYFNTYEIFEFKNFYLIHIIEEYCCLGTADADVKKDMWKFSEKKWLPEILELKHWEDGVHKYKYYPKYKHWALYLLNIKAPKGAYQWRKNEYQDYDNFIPEDCEYIEVI